MADCRPQFFLSWPLHAQSQLQATSKHQESYSQHFVSVVFHIPQVFHEMLYFAIAMHWCNKKQKGYVHWKTQCIYHHQPWEKYKVNEATKHSKLQSQRRVVIWLYSQRKRVDVDCCVMCSGGNRYGKVGGSQLF